MLTTKHVPSCTPDPIVAWLVHIRFVYISYFSGGYIRFCLLIFAIHSATNPFCSLLHFHSFSRSDFHLNLFLFFIVPSAFVTIVVAFAIHITVRKFIVLFSVFLFIYLVYGSHFYFLYE